MDPSGFADRLGLQRGVQLTEAGQPLLDEAYEEAIAATYERVELALGESGSSVGEGSLFVTTRCVQTAQPCFAFIARGGCLIMRRSFCVR